MQNIACDWEFASYGRNTIRRKLAILITATKIQNVI